MEYHFGKPDHHPVDAPGPGLYASEFQADRNADFFGCAWQTLGVLLLGLLLALVIAIYASPDESAAPQTKPSPAAAVATVGNSATIYTPHHTMETTTTQPDEPTKTAFAKHSKANELLARHTKLVGQRKEFGEALSLAFSKQESGYTPLGAPVIAFAKSKKQGQDWDSVLSHDHYPSSMAFIGAQQPGAQMAAAMMVVEIIRALDQEKAEAEAEFVALLA